MAHPYTTRARVRIAAVAHEMTDWVDANGDGVEDSGVVPGHIERACNRIDGALGQRFSTPFAATAGVADAGLLADIADELTIAFMLRRVDRPRADAIMAQADAELAKIASGATYIDATLRDADERRGGVRYESAGTIVAGNVDGNYTSTGVRKSYGF